MAFSRLLSASIALSLELQSTLSATVPGKGAMGSEGVTETVLFVAAEGETIEQD